MPSVYVKKKLRKQEVLGLSANHERVLVVAKLVGGVQTRYKASDLLPLLSSRGNRPRATAIAQALRYLAHHGYIRQVGPGLFAKCIELVEAEVRPPKPPHTPETFQSPTPAQMMIGKARAKRPRQVDLEQPLWPEDAPK